MKTAAALTMAIFEAWQLKRIVSRYSDDGDPWDFFTKAPLDKVAEAILHARLSLIALGAASILSVLP